MEDNQKYYQVINKELGTYSDFIFQTNPIDLMWERSLPPFYLDDLDLYKNFSSAHKEKFISDYEVGDAIQSSIDEYFGNESDSYMMALVIYNEHLNSDYLSIKELKQKNVAFNVERAALAHNLLLLKGINNELMFGKLNDKDHAWIVFDSLKNSNSKVLFDPTYKIAAVKYGIPRSLVNLSILSEEEYQDLKKGEPYQFDYSYIEKNNSKDYVYKETDRVYRSDSHVKENGR